MAKKQEEKKVKKETKEVVKEEKKRVINFSEHYRINSNNYWCNNYSCILSKHCNMEYCSSITYVNIVNICS